MNHGALVNILRNLFCNICILFTLDGAAFVQMGQAYSIMGLMIVSYSVIAFVSESLEVLLSIGLSWINLILACCVFILMWFFQFSLVSRFRPKYFIGWFDGVQFI